MGNFKNLKFCFFSINGHEREIPWRLSACLALLVVGLTHLGVLPAFLFGVLAVFLFGVIADRIGFVPGDRLDTQNEGLGIPDFWMAGDLSLSWKKKRMLQLFGFKDQQQYWT